jgi:hypothetical protein
MSLKLFPLLTIFRFTIITIFTSQIHRYGDVAQLVEQRTENSCVGGSIPFITTENKNRNHHERNRL